MINKSTLRLLNDIAFGADIDSLESYMINFKQASMLCDLHRDTKRYNILYDILRDMKGNSLLFSDRTNLKPTDKDNMNDMLFKKYPNRFLDVGYSVDSDEIIKFENTIKNKFNNNIGLIALANICGIHVKCVYANGYLRTIYVIGETEKYLDVTNIISDLVPDYIPELKQYELVELRGKVTTSRVEHLIPECSTLHYINYNYNINTLQLFIDDIIMDANELPYDNYWSKLEYIEDIGFKVPTRALILDVDSNILSNAVLEMDNYITENTTTIYKYFGIQIIVNDTIDKQSIVYIGRYCDSNKRFSSKLKSIQSTVTNDYNIVSINILPVKCNDNVTIDKVIMNDVYNIELQQLTIGKEVEFYVLNNTAYMLDK